MPYQFDERKEYETYKKIGKKGGCPNYCNWEERIIKRYIPNTDRKFFTNMKAYLNKKNHSYIIDKELLISLIVPLLSSFITLTLVLPAILISLNQYNDSIQSDLNNIYLNDLRIVHIDPLKDINSNEFKTEWVKLLEEQVSCIKSRQEDNINTINTSFDVIIIIYFFLIFCGVILWFFIKRRSKKILFYGDYIEIIEKLEARLSAKNDYSSDSTIKRLEELTQLRDKKLITDEEFRTKKKDIIDKM